MLVARCTRSSMPPEILFLKGGHLLPLVMPLYTDRAIGIKMQGKPFGANKIRSGRRPVFHQSNVLALAVRHLNEVSVAQLRLAEVSAVPPRGELPPGAEAQVGRSEWPSIRIYTSTC